MKFDHKAKSLPQAFLMTDERLNELQKIVNEVFNNDNFEKASARAEAIIEAFNPQNDNECFFAGMAFERAYSAARGVSIEIPIPREILQGIHTQQMSKPGKRRVEN